MTLISRAEAIRAFGRSPEEVDRMVKAAIRLMQMYFAEDSIPMEFIPAIAGLNGITDYPLKQQFKPLVTVIKEHKAV